MADDAKLAAIMLCALATKGTYLPVCDGPRLQRPDHHIEIIRRHNAVGRSRARSIYATGLSDESFAAMSKSLSTNNKAMLHRVSSEENASAFENASAKNGTLTWARDRIGIGVLKALRENKAIRFTDEASPDEGISSLNGHVVVCEDGEELSQVIAASYAFALGAGLVIIPGITRDRAEDILDSFYTVYDRIGGELPADAQTRLAGELMARCGSLPIPDNGSVTFIGKLPYGFAYPEIPTTHLFDYPDLGCAVVNGFAAEQPGNPGIGVVTLVDPGTTPAPEIEAAIQLLTPRGSFIRVYESNNADVRNVSEMLEHFPYDLLIIATHCGDSNGYRWTYEFDDSDGRHRKLVVDIAVSFARTDDRNIVRVGQFMRFISLDGVDWSDTEGKEKLPVGNAIIDFMKMSRHGPNELRPVHKDTVKRVVGSSALMMSDGNLIFAHHTLADMGTPIIFANACLSWHRLAANMIYGGARAYVGTLFPILAQEAAEVATRLLDAHWGKPLPVALWQAQRDVYSGLRRPYVVAGVFPQRLRVEFRDYPQRLQQRLERSLAAWQKHYEDADPNDPERRKEIDNVVNIYAREVAHFRAENN